MDKRILFCLGSREELFELQDCIKKITGDGHEVYILYEFPPLPLLDRLGARVYADELPPVPIFEKFLFEMIVVGHQSEIGKKIVPKAEKVTYRILYQGEQSKAGEWLSLHEHLFLVWGLYAENIADWNQEAHQLWITHGRGNQEHFTKRIRGYLSED